MKKGQKLLGEERRNHILKILKNRTSPITGSELAKVANVSRQVIVGDITLLKTQNEPIIATSQGYIFIHSNNQETLYERTVACLHKPDETEQELLILVDTGVTVKDVKIEHPIYGDLVASIMVNNRREVKQFLQKFKKQKPHTFHNLQTGYIYILWLHLLCKY